MAGNLQATKADLIARVAALARERHGGRGAGVEAFLREYFDGVAAEDLAGWTVDDLYGAGVAHWRQAQRRRPKEALVEVYTPDVERNGWQSPHTVIEVLTGDMPFLVDSVTMEVSRHQLGIYLVIHPVIAVQRDSSGRLVEAAGDSGVAESFIHVQVTRVSRPDLLDSLRADLLRVLADVQSAVDDWEPMRDRATAAAEALDPTALPIPAEEVSEGAALLRWLAADHFIFLGYREYRLEERDDGRWLCPVAGTELGVVRRGVRGEGAGGSNAGVTGGWEPPPTRLSAAAAELASQPHLLVLTKANSRATVHRASRLDYVGVKQFGAGGEVVGEQRFLGLYSVSAYTSRASEIPVVRRKVASVIHRAGFVSGSHSEKSLLEVLETYPRDELFQASVDELFNTAMAVAAIQERQQVRLFLRADPFGRFVSCLVYLPRDRYTTLTRTRIEHLLQSSLGGTSSEFTTYLSESVLARLHFIVHTDGGAPGDIDVSELQDRVAEATRSWEEDLEDALVDQCGEEEGIGLHQRYAAAFPAGYRDDFSPRAAVADIRRIDQIEASGGLAMTLYRPLDAADSLLRFKLVGSGPPVSLSDILPVLENMGVRVADEHPYTVKAPEVTAWIYDFGLLVEEADQLASEKIGASFQEAVARALHGDVESDGFNRLVLSAGLSWREVVVLRAGCKYLRQTQMTFSQAYVEDTLSRHPGIARQLVELFELRFDPGRQNLSEVGAAQLVSDITRAIDAVESLDDDRILRRYLHLVNAMVRTNYFQDGQHHGSRARDYLAFKVDGSKIPELPMPRPAYEIFVYSPRTEGVHLRASLVARGGIRWSDRREDFRTEILGLMKAQTVKNAVIVPTGAKGGFVVKRPPITSDRDALMAEAVACYQSLISGMLDLTDNLSDGRVEPPPGVVRYDGDDSYLVVAADKGTATLSDAANDISLERGFWLGDAFASGGSSGYDHKQLGITARGAWESVKHHFAQLGIDVQTTEFTVVGVGDMSGDVFGNGMLLSPHIKLVGAFDHRHIFLDPDPDPSASLAERRRLFAQPRSSWADYDQSLISAGGGVYPRSAKSVAISPQVADCLGITASTLTPTELISALLRAPVDLLWNGGIGTYVKASSESNADAGDRVNDAVRVDACDLRCRVVGEGGNLGFTQKARVEYALAGGLINTDAIDNSAGVDCSDHEVNLKILLDGVVASGDLTLKQRNRLLADMADEVVDLVLQDNKDQNQALSNANTESTAMVDVHARYMRHLEETGRLDRALEALPTDDELSERAASGRGLVVPEFAVLLAYAKIVAYAELIGSSVPDEPHFDRDIAAYFPPTLRERFAEEIRRHPLRREIIATRLANSTVNFGGTSLVFRIGQETGASVPDIVRAHVAAREVFAADRLCAGIDTCRGQVTAATYVEMTLEARKLVERATRWFLRHRRSPLDIDATIASFLPGVEALVPALDDLVAPSDREAIDSATADLLACGVPNQSARLVASLDTAFSCLDIVEVAGRRELSVEAVARVYFVVGECLDLDWLRDQIVGLPRTDRWQALAREALRDDLYQQRAALTAAVLDSYDGSVEPRRLVDRWTMASANAIDRVLAVLADIRAAPNCDLATLCVAVRELRGLVDRGHAGG